MSTTARELAELSTLRTQLEELTLRIQAVAERFGNTPDSSVTTELFSAERSLFAVRRSLERAERLLEG